MPFHAIKGTFHVVGYSPDGDSIRFKADNPDNWDQLRGNVDLNQRGHAQLRIEAIDTLETHYKGQHQPRRFADLATNELFSLLGIENVIWNGSRVSSADDGVEGFILSRAAERNGRPVAFVFNQAAGFTDGEEVYLDVNTAEQSVNYKMLDAALLQDIEAYPMASPIVQQKLPLLITLKVLKSN